MASKRPIRSGTLDNIPGIGDDFRQMYRDLKRMESTTSIISDISEEELKVDSNTHECVELAERLHGVDLNDADAIWSKLSESERQQIGQVMQKQNMNAVLPTFNPWWENKVQRIQISEVNGDHTDIVSTEHEWRDLQHPKIKKTIAEFSKVSKEPPTKDIDDNLTNVLAAYTSTVRFFYGEHLRSAYDAVKYLVAICSSLKSNPITLVEPNLAIEAIRTEARKEGLTIEDDDLIQMKKDIYSIHEGPDPNFKTNCYILAALSDLYRLFQLAKSRSSSSLAPRKAFATANNTLEIVAPQDQAKDLRQFISRFGDYKIVEFIPMERKTICSTMKKVEYFLAYAKQFLSYS
ncbi:uncharacterized protein LOC129580285 [Sitodiplosis mosellana]|uniref:uncharacterized protein LOC129580285 n=1 Tax=Sitodiplosis mosellana TaxID=263140 RepID=UPI002443DA2B|nr:uncharacterized protein LOC129580285 [Sitodiplosis mosellana]